VRTLAAPSSFDLVIKHSRFIAHSSRVDSQADTLDFYESVADPNATHNCWAWRLDYLYRFNDDGEPASTAGKPILSAIEGKGLDNVMVVVTRYFGGTKLGVGGLIRAYSGSASKSLDQAKIVEIQAKVECTIKAAFQWTGQVYAALENCKGKKLSEDFLDDGIFIRAEINENELQRLKLMLRDTSRGEVVLHVSGDEL
jgi:uncharacterized YigZ family protein